MPALTDALPTQLPPAIPPAPVDPSLQPQASATLLPLPLPPRPLLASGVAGESPRRKLDPLDPAARHAAQMTPLSFAPSDPTTQAATTTPETEARASLESILPDLVRKIAWTGDGKRGSMRLELGRGSLAGATLVVHADEGRVRVELDAPGGTDVDEWRQKLHERLLQRGVEVEELVVR